MVINGAVGLCGALKGLESAVIVGISFEESSLVEVSNPERRVALAFLGEGNRLDDIGLALVETLGEGDCGQAGSGTGRHGCISKRRCSLKDIFKGFFRFRGPQCMLACCSPEQTHQRSSIVPNRLIEIKSFLERDLRIFAEMTLLK